MYTEAEVNKIVRLCLDGEILADAKSMVRGFNPEVIAIADVVKEYFGITSLAPKSRRKEEISPMSTFFYLINELLDKPRLKQVYFTCIELTKKDRTTFINYCEKYSREDHLHDKLPNLGDCNTNHFIKIKEILTGEDLSDQYVEVFKNSYTHETVNKFYFRKFRENEAEILKAIESNQTFDYINDNFFGYANTTSLRYNMRVNDNKLYERVFKPKNKVELNMMEYGDEIKRRIEKGDTFKIINDRYFQYNQLSEFRKTIKSYDLKLYKKLIKNEYLNMQ